MQRYVNCSLIAELSLGRVPLPSANLPAVISAARAPQPQVTHDSTWQSKKELQRKQSNHSEDTVKTLGASTGAATEIVNQAEVVLCIYSMRLRIYTPTTTSSFFTQIRAPELRGYLWSTD